MASEQELRDQIHLLADALRPFAKEVVIYDYDMARNDPVPYILCKYCGGSISRGVAKHTNNCPQQRAKKLLENLNL